MSNIDMAGFIVAVLDVITTILLGWNIYTVIDFKEKIRQVNEQSNRTKGVLKEIYNSGKTMDGYTHNMIANAYLSILNQNIDYSIYIVEKVHAISLYSYAEQFDQCNQIVTDIMSYVSSDIGKKLSEEEYHEIYNLLHDIKNRDKIDKFDDMMLKMLHLSGKFQL